MKKDLKKAISEWVRSLPVREAKAKSIFFCGEGYSPLQILKEVEHETNFGIEFLTGLYALNRQMLKTNPNASIEGLIRQSMKRAS
jgi:hypothetical protein